ncbi:MAG: cytochrome c oxidase subunit II [Gammaproteobacteria bacterium]|nr:cytochrome c oxidase subunit II [Gammaproteobacteria bacterium]
MFIARAAWRLLVGSVILLAAVPALAEWAINMPRGVTPISHEIYDLHMTIFSICVAIGALVFGVMFFSIWKHRKSRGAKADNFHESQTVEIIWTVIPFLILIGMAFPATKTLIKMEDMSDIEMTVKITGYQWMWHYDYLEDGVSFYSRLDANSNKTRQLDSGLNPGDVPDYLLNVDKPLVLPVGVKIRLLTTAADVIHSWWVPQLGVKKDAIPGFINEFWTQIEQPGVYRGVCAELCGKDHGFMPVVVKAVNQDEYQAWLQSQRDVTPKTASL